MKHLLALKISTRNGDIFPVESDPRSYTNVISFVYVDIQLKRKTPHDIRKTP